MSQNNQKALYIVEAKEHLKVYHTSNTYQQTQRIFLGRPERKKKMCIIKPEDVYTFGFNGQEKDNEIAGIGNHNTALFWEYDTRLGRRWNLDPKPNPSTSSYSSFANNPIFFIDVKGDSAWATSTTVKNKDGTSTTTNTTHITGKVLDLTGSSEKEQQSLVDGINKRMNSEKTVSQDANGNKTIFNIEAEFCIANSVYDVMPEDHLLVVVDHVTGKADPLLGGGKAGGCNSNCRI